MQVLMLNHARGRLPAPAVCAWGVALLLCAVGLLVAYRQLDAGNMALQQQLHKRQASLQQDVPRQAANGVAANQAVASEVADARAHIQTPWLPLLSALEQVHQPDLYWMQLAPDAGRKHLRMTVLTYQRQQGWALAERLKKQAALTDVKLNASESTDVNGLPMTTVHLEAGWKF